MTDGELGAYLRTLRRSAGLTQIELAGRMSCSQSKIQKIETGQNRLTARDLRTAAAVLGVVGPELDAMIDWAARVDAGYQRRPRAADEISTAFREFRRGEQLATEIYALHGERFPGLLQCEEFMRALFAGRPADEVERRVAERLGRARLLAGPLRYSVVLGEAAVIRLTRAHPREVAAAQLAHLVDVATAVEGVSLRVLDFDADVPFVPTDVTVLRFGGARKDFGYQESAIDARVIDRAVDVEALVRVWWDIAGRSLDEQESLVFLKDALERLR
ncbi:helix-turn-helix domain-containing protein [Actinokineospora sp. G85]|uniref:helix-turn-helix domain-containing protein n=1 Tax=Actinokineospora sp. G85 TaxID=3406626 RepID=UPI003C74FA31